MNYTDTDGNPATGVVWSPGPLPGTVWVLPESGARASAARVVRLNRRAGTWEQVSARNIEAGKEKAVKTLKDESGSVWPTHMVSGGSDLAQRAAHRQAFNDGRGLPAKDWHAALGFTPAERVQCFEANDQPTLLDLTA